MTGYCRLWTATLAVVVCALVLLPGACGAYTQGDPEFRAFWIDAWHAGALSQAGVDQLLGVVGAPSSKGDIRNANCNAVILQVRRNADTLYPSHMGEPYMTGISPADFNGLQAVINAAHDTTGGKQRIEVHCWMVTFRTSGGAVYQRHSDPNDPDNYWPSLTDTGSVVSDRGLDPGHPKCEEYTVNVAMDLVNNFDIDGVHFDYIRFTGNNQGYNPTSVARYNARYGLTGQPSSSSEQFKQWRRDQVSAVVRKVYAKIQSTKPWVKLSGSFVTWDPSPTASTRAKFQGTRPYYDVYCDWDSWLTEGIVDMAVPMTYYRQPTAASGYTRWMNFEKDRHGNRHMVVGPGIYLNSLSNSILQLQKTRDVSPAGNGAQGFSGYSYFAPFTNGGTNYGTWTEFAPVFIAQVATSPAVIPVMDWKLTPTKGHISGTVTYYTTGAWADGATVTVSGPDSPPAQRCDGTGFYSFIDLTPGVYTVTFTQPGWPMAQKIVNVAVGAVTGNMYVTDVALGAPAPPIVMDVAANNIDVNSAMITWTTDVPATSRVEYGLTTSYEWMTPLDSNVTTLHAVTLANLTPKTLYHYRVTSANSKGPTTSGDFTFTTHGPPIISDVVVTNIAAESATVSWVTDQPATSQVQYGTTSSLGQATIEDTNLVTSHSVNLTNLTASTVYHVSAISTNVYLLTGQSDEVTFATTPEPLTFIVDNPQGATLGMWTALTDPGGWPTDASQYVYANNMQSLTTCTFTWRPNIPVAGRYNVYCWYNTGANYTTSARYSVYYAGGMLLTSVVNQSQTGGQWVPITNAKLFAAGTSGYVILTNKTRETDGTKKVIADAIKFEYADIDVTPPSAPTNLVATAVSTSEIDLTWSPSSDDFALLGYKVFRDSEIIAITTSPSYADTNLISNTQYSYYVLAYDASSNESAPSAVVSRYTLSPQLTTADINCDRSTGQHYNTPPFTFTNSGFGPGKVTSYRYAWDNSAGHTWNQSETSWTTPTKTVNATNVEPWYLHVSGYNGDGVSNGTLNIGPYYGSNVFGSIADAMNNPDGTTVTIEFKPITAVMGSSFYIEEPNQTRGLRIDMASQLPVGSKSLMATVPPVGKGVKVTGTLAGSGDERHLRQAAILNAVDDSAPLPLLLRSTALGGAAPDQYTSGIAGASGAYSIGLLVRVLGRVVSHTTGSFVIDDGSFLKDSSGVRIKVTTKVYSTLAVSDGAFVRATGVCVVENGACVLRTRTLDDVTVY